MILDFNLVLPGGRPEALDERDRLIGILRDNGYHLLMTDDGTRVLMEQQTRRPKPAPPCTCCCNPGHGLGIELNCGGCGHAGCGMRGR